MAANMFRNARDVVTADAGSVLFGEGSEGHEMFALVEGSVELSRGGVVMDTLHDGALFGEMALIDGSPRSATATCLTPSRIARIDEREFLWLVQEHPTFALQVMRVMTERLRRANELSAP